MDKSGRALGEGRGGHRIRIAVFWLKLNIGHHVQTIERDVVVNELLRSMWVNPLGTLVPTMERGGAVNEPIRPRSMWVNRRLERWRMVMASGLPTFKDPDALAGEEPVEPAILGVHARAGAHNRYHGRYKTKHSRRGDRVRSLALAVQLEPFTLPIRTKPYICLFAPESGLVRLGSLSSFQIGTSVT